MANKHMCINWALVSFSKIDCCSYARDLKRSKKKVVLMLENKLGFDFINILRVRLDRIYFAETEN